jgi:hypothetical protein
MWYILIGLVACLSSGISTFGASKPDPRVAEIKKDARVFEKIVTEVLRQTFENPFAVSADPQAAFVPGHGVVVSFLVKINRGTLRGFTEASADADPGRPRSTEEQLERVRETVLRSLAEYAGTLKHLSSGERVTICAHVEDRNELDPSKSRTDIVASSLKSDIDEYLTRRIDDSEFRRRVQYLEY